jgi:hypothetical protein
VSINWLLIAMPAAAPLVFFVAALAIVPLVALARSP